MSFVKAVEEAFKKAVDHALCRVSRKRFGEITPDEISCAMKELAKLKSKEQQPDYCHPDVALFYTQWFLPQQINVTYSESVQVLRQSRLSSANTLQLVDFGAGTGAMTIGLSLAIAAHVPREHWPERLRVYQIDHPAMLELGRDVWHYVRDESSRQTLHSVAEIMDRTQFKCIPISDTPHYDPFPRWKDATRWLTAIHVVYTEDMETINRKMELLSKYLMPDVRIRTAPAIKKCGLQSDSTTEEAPHPICLCLQGCAPRITALRKDLGSRIRNLNVSVPWTDIGKESAPFAETVYGPGATLDA